MTLKTIEPTPTAAVAARATGADERVDPLLPSVAFGFGILASLRWGGLCHNRIMTDVVDDGISQLTFLEQDGHSFLHVGVADGDITVGCSTRMSLMDCFAAVGRVASEDEDLFAVMGGGETEAFVTAQPHDATPSEADIALNTLHLPNGWRHEPHEFADKLAKVGYDGSFPAVRVDIGKSSWQWDDFSQSQTSREGASAAFWIRSW